MSLAPAPLPDSPPATRPSLAATLLLDARGRIVAAGGAAREWWATGCEAKPFVSFLIFEVISDDADLLEMQWDSLAASAGAGPLKVTVRPDRGGAFDARLRLEELPEGAVAAANWMATLEKETPRIIASAVGDAAGKGFPLFPLLAEQSLAGFFDLNFATGETYYSPAWKRQLGYDDEELENHYDTWIELIHPDDSTAAPDYQSKKLFAGARPFSVEFRLRHKHGHYVWVQSLGVQIFDAEGELERVAGLHLDIGERKEFEETGLQNEERLQLLCGRGPLGLFDFDFAAGRFWLSPAAKALLGYGENDLPALPGDFEALLPADESASGLAVWLSAKFAGQATFSEAVRFRAKNGETRWVHLSAVRAPARRREPPRIAGALLALPERVPLNSQRGLPRPQLLALLDELREGVALGDANGRIVYLNSKAASLAGVGAASAVGLLTSEVIRLVHAQTGVPAESPVDRVLASGDALPLNEEFVLHPLDGDQRPVAWRCLALKETTGSIAGAVLFFRDPQEMRLTPEELVQANRYESLGLLAGGIAHDLNNLLTTILGGVTLAREARDYSGLEDSDAGCLAAKGLTKQLLSFVKGGTAARQIVRPSEIVSDAARLAAAGSTVTVEVALASDLPTLSVDRAQVLQVFQNLIINALQAMTAGRGQVWISGQAVRLAEGQIPPLAPGEYVQIDVRDNGSGIPPELLQRIFDPFFTTKKTGTGLGLSTVLSIVQKHGGQIGVESQPGVGTTFSVFLPKADAEIQVEARRAPTLRYGTGRILLMDDDPRICQLTASMLTGLGYTVDVARHGGEALALYQRQLNVQRPYEAALLDLTIVGGMGGEETFLKLRELDGEARAIVTSGYDNDEMARRFLELGFCGYLTKPYRATDLARILKTVLGEATRPA